jgi:hypothetical protein
MASTALNHLNIATRTQAQLDDKARIELIKRDRWIDYPRATEAMSRLERLLGTPKRERMPCMVLHGQSNIGKTLIIRKFQREHPDSFDEAKGVERRSIVAMQMPATPDQHRFYSALLFELGAPHSATAGIAALERLARDLLRRIAPRILIVDEVHHLLAGSYREQRASLNLLKYLANDLHLCIVLVGTADAPLALQSDSQMSSRFSPFELTRWQINDEFRRFLAAFERVIPLRRASDLGKREIVEYVFAYSAGLTGEIARLLNQSAEYAILDRSEMIKLEHLEHAARLGV